MLPKLLSANCVLSDGHWKMTCFSLGSPQKTIWAKVLVTSGLSGIDLKKQSEGGEVGQGRQENHRGWIKEQAANVGERGSIFLGSFVTPKTTRHGLSCQGMRNSDIYHPTPVPHHLRIVPGSVNSAWAERDLRQRGRRFTRSEAIGPYTNGPLRPG